MTELTAARSAKLPLRTPLTIVWRFGLACLLAALAFLPYVLSILSAVVPRWGGYLSPPLSMGGGIGSPGGGRSLDFSYQPWGTLLVAALFALLMYGKLLMDNRRSTQKATRWRSGGLLLVMFLLISAFVLWQAPIAPSLSIVSTHFSDVPEVAFATMILSIYPCFFATFTSVFLCRTQRRERGASWLPLVLSLPTVLASVLLFLLPFPMYHDSWAKFYASYSANIDPPPLLAVLYILPTLLGASLLGGWLGRALSIWLPHPLGNSVEAATPANPPVDAQHADHLGVLWGFTWRLVLIGLIAITITGPLLHMHISGGSYMFAPQGIGITLTLSYLPGHWFLPPFLWFGLFSSLGSAWFLTFLPFLLTLPGTLAERRLREKHTMLVSMGIMLALLFLIVGAKDLVLCFYDYLVFFLGRSLPFFEQPGASAFMTQVVPPFCETTALAAMSAIALGSFSRPLGKGSRRLFWLLLGMTSFAGSLLPLEDVLQNVPYLSLDTTSIVLLLASGFVLAALAACLGGWLRTLAMRRVTQVPFR